MKNKNDISKISKQFYDLCSHYYNYEKFIKTIAQDIKYKGYIINETIIQNLKKKIKYDELKKHICNKMSYIKIKKKIEDICGKELFKKFKIKDIDNSEDLKKELIKEKKYYIINSELFKNICVTGTYKGIHFLIKGEQLILIFNENDNLTFRNNNFIIEISTLIKEDQDSQIENKETNNKEKNKIKKISQNNESDIFNHQYNNCQINIYEENNIKSNYNNNLNKEFSQDIEKNNYFFKQFNLNNLNNINIIKNIDLEEKINDNNNFNNNILKIQKNNNILFYDKIKVSIPKDNINEKIIEIILLIYQFNKDLKNVINNSLKFMNNEEYKDKKICHNCYFINKEWLNKFKNFYSYNKIEEYIKNKDLS